MPHYHFEDQADDFGATVRLDRLNDKVREETERGATQEFHPVKPASSLQPSPREKVKPSGASGRSSVSMPGQESQPENKNFWKAVILAGVLVFFCIFVGAMVYTGGGPSEATVPEGSANTPVLTDAQRAETSEGLAVLLPGNGRTIALYDIDRKEQLQLTVDLETKFQDEQGQVISYTGLAAGDVVAYERKGESDILGSLALAPGVWRLEQVTGAEVDFAAREILLDGKTYHYGEDAYFIFEDKTVSPGDISPLDTVTIMGKGEEVLSLRVEASHGYLYFKNRQLVDHLQVLLDEEEMPLDLSTGLVELGCGRHQLEISGDNIEPYTVYVNIDQDERTTLDLSQAAKKVEMGTITVTVNPAGALIYVDGIEQPAGQSVIETTPGSHRIDVYLEGYERWGQTVEVGAQPLSLQVQLKKIAEVTPYFPPVPEEVPEKEQTPETGNCIVYTDPGWAKVYIDGDYVGVSPVMTSLPFGEHEIRAELNGEENTETVDVQGPDTRVTISLQEND